MLSTASEIFVESKNFKDCSKETINGLKRSWLLPEALVEIRNRLSPVTGVLIEGVIVLAVFVFVSLKD